MSQGLYNLHSYHSKEDAYDTYDYYRPEKPMPMNVVVVVVIAFVVALVIVVVVVRLCMKHEWCNGCVPDNDSMQDTLDEPDDVDQELSSMDEHEEVGSRLVLTMERHSNDGELLPPEHAQYEDNLSDEINTAAIGTYEYSSPTVRSRLPEEMDANTQLNRLHFLERGEDYDEDSLRRCAIENSYKELSNRCYGDKKSQRGNQYNDRALTANHSARSHCENENCHQHNRFQHSENCNQRKGNHSDELCKDHVSRPRYGEIPDSYGTDLRSLDIEDYGFENENRDDLCTEEYIFPSLDESLL